MEIKPLWTFFFFFNQFNYIHLKMELLVEYDILKISVKKQSRVPFEGGTHSGPAMSCV